MVKEEVIEPKQEQDDEISTVLDPEGSIPYPSNSADGREQQTQDVGVELYDPQLLSTSHPQSDVQDIMVQSVAGPSTLPVVSTVENDYEFSSIMRIYTYIFIY